MSFEINITNASKTLKQFIKAHGGDTKHSEVLELLAGICGFGSYRALNASATTNRSNVEKSGKETGLRTLEDTDKVAFQATAVDWLLADSPDISLEDFPASKRTPYDVIFEQYGNQFRLLVKPQGTNLDNFEGKAVLDCSVEINEGVPCLHLTNDPADAMLISVFATGAGLLVRQDEGNFVRARSVSLPPVLKDLVEAACGPVSEQHNAYVALWDTAEKYATQSEPVTAQETKATVVSDTYYPEARTALVNPANSRHVGSYVSVSFDDRLDGEQLWLDIDLHDVNGVIGDDDHVGAMFGYSEDWKQADRASFAESMSGLVAFLVEADVDFRRIERLVHAILATGSQVQMAKDCFSETFVIGHKNSAYAILWAKVNDR